MFGKETVPNAGLYPVAVGLYMIHFYIIILLLLIVHAILYGAKKQASKCIYVLYIPLQLRRLEEEGPADP